MQLRGPLRGLLAACALLAGCTAAPEQPESKPALWEVTGEGGAHGYLFGTVHSLSDSYTWRSDVLDRSFDAARTLVVEIGPIPGDESVFRDLATSAGLPPLSRRVSPENRQKLAEIYRATGQDDGDFASSESWAAAIQIANAFQAGDGANGVDVGLMERGRDKRLVELEGVAGQLRIFDELPEKEQRDMLDIVVSEAAGARQHSARMIEQWRAGDVGALESELSSGLLADPELHETLLTARNRAWVPRIEQLLQSGSEPFVAVGAAHMLGVEGLPALLAQRGYSVTRIQ